MTVAGVVRQDVDRRAAGTGALRFTGSRRVVVLVDEYDKPVLDALHDPDRARANRESLRGIYGIIKDSAAHVRFVLVIPNQISNHRQESRISRHCPFSFRLFPNTGYGTAAPVTRRITGCLTAWRSHQSICDYLFGLVLLA